MIILKEVLCPLGVTLCVEHSGCYTNANIARHLARSHSLKARWVREILDFILCTGPIASCPSNIAKPGHRGRPISSLPIHDSYCYDAADCNFLTANVDFIKQHCSKLHGWNRLCNSNCDGVIQCSYQYLILVGVSRTHMSVL